MDNKLHKKLMKILRSGATIQFVRSGDRASSYAKVEIMFLVVSEVEKTRMVVIWKVGMPCISYLKWRRQSFLKSGQMHVCSRRDARKAC